MANQTHTNKELLEILLIKTQENAKSQLNFAASVSNFMNEQAVINAEIKGYLESNTKTNQKGLVEQVSSNTDNLQSLEREIRIDKAKVYAIGATLTIAINYIVQTYFK